MDPIPCLHHQTRFLFLFLEAEVVYPNKIFFFSPDKFEMVVQAFEYEKKHLLSKDEVEKRKENGTCDTRATKKSKLETSETGNDNKNSQEENNGDIRPDVFSEPLRGFFKTTRSVLKTPIFRRLDAELRERREKFLEEKGWSVTEEEKQETSMPN
jgi:hypothetical protein